jgi:hypothetical protein
MKLHIRMALVALPFLTAALFLTGPGPAAPLNNPVSPACCRCGAVHAAGWDTRLDGGTAKIDPEVAADETCGPPAAAKGFNEDLLPSLSAGHDREPAEDAAAGKRISVAALVQTALNDQARLLDVKMAELEHWNGRDRAVFFKWFGTADEEARLTLARRVTLVRKINELYTVRNFRRAPHRPGVFAFVRPADPSKVFVDLQFVKAPRLGENSRAGTITHEMSHFFVAGGTKDHMYGTAKCKQLARSNPELALTNADNFEYWVENAR